MLVHFAFQSRDLLAQRRLRDMQHFSRLGQAADIDDFTKYFSRLKFMLPLFENSVPVTAVLLNRFCNMDASFAAGVCRC